MINKWLLDPIKRGLSTLQNPETPSPWKSSFEVERETKSFNFFNQNKIKTDIGKSVFRPTPLQEATKRTLTRLEESRQPTPTRLPYHVNANDLKLTSVDKTLLSLSSWVLEAPARLAAFTVTDPAAALVSAYKTKDSENRFDAWLEHFTKKNTEIRLPIDARRIGMSERNMKTTAGDMLDLIDSGHSMLEAGLMVSGSKMIDVGFSASIVRSMASATIPTLKRNDAVARVEASKILNNPSTGVEARTNFRKLANIYTPDKPNGLGSKEAFQLIEEARRTLGQGPKFKPVTLAEQAKYNAYRIVEPMSKETVIANILKHPPIFKDAQGKIAFKVEPRKWKEIWGEAATFPGRFSKPELINTHLRPHDLANTENLLRLPGYRPVDTPHPNIGLSIQKWEAVGGVKKNIANELVSKFGKEKAANIIRYKGESLVRDVAVFGIKNATSNVMLADVPNLLQPRVSEQYNRIREAIISEQITQVFPLKEATLGVEELTPSLFKLRGDSKLNKLIQSPKTTKGRTEPLIQEATKYKSAEEFVRAQPTMYHGTAQVFDKFKTEFLGESTGAKSAKEGIFLTNQKDLAEGYSVLSMGNRLDKLGISKDAMDAFAETGVVFPQNEKDISIVRQIVKEGLLKDFGDGAYGVVSTKDTVKEVFVDGNLKIVDMGGADRTKGDFIKIIEQAKKENYSGIIIKNTKDYPLAHSGKILDDVTVVFDPKNIKTKPQLEQIWKDAQNDLWRQSQIQPVERVELKMPDSELPPNILADETLKKDPNSTEAEMEAPVQSERDILNPARDFETLLNLKVDAKEAQRILLDIAKGLGLDSALIKKMRPGVGGYMIMDKKFPQMAARNMWDLAVYAHEIGHALDLSLYKTTTEYWANESRLKHRIEKVPIETLITNANKLGINIQEILAQPETKFRLELTKARDYVRNFEGKRFKDTRSDPSELFASWFVSYIHDYNTTKLIAPNFTNAMEAAYLDTLNMIREKYQFPIEKTDIARDVPIEKSRGLISKWLDIQLKAIDAAKTEDIKQQKKLNSWVKWVNDTTIEWIKPPYWYSLTNEQFRGIYQEFTNTAVYGAEGTSARLFLESGLMEMDKESQTFRDLVMRKFYEGTDQKTYYTEEQLKENYSFTEKEVQAYKKIEKVLTECTELMVEAQKIDLGYYDMGISERADIDAKARKMVQKQQGYFPKTRSGKWIVYAEMADKLTYGQTKEIVYNRFDHKRQPLFSAEPIANAQQYAADLKQRGYTNIVIKPVAKVNMAEAQRISRYGNIPWWEFIRLIESMGIDKTDPAIAPIIEKLQQEKAQKWGGRVLERKDTPGLEYSFREGESALLSFIEDATRIHAKTKARYNIRKLQANIDGTKYAETISRTDKWVRNVFNNTDKQGWTAARKLIYTWFLSWKVSYLVQNMCQPIMTTMGEVGNYLNPIQTPIVWKKGYEMSMNYARHRATEGEGNALKDLISPKNREQEALFYELMDRGVDEGHISGHFQNKMMQVKQYVKNSNIDNMLGFFSIISETVNRTHAMSTGYEIAVNHLNMTDSEAIFKFMKQMSHNTQFAYGNFNVPFIMNDTGRMKSVLKTLIVFKTFSINYMNFFWHRILRGEHFTEQQLRQEYKLTDAEIANWKKKKGRLPAEKIYGISNMITLAGIKGLPFFALINLLPRWLFGKQDIITQLRQLIGDDDDYFYDYLMGGAFSWLNMSTSNLLGVGELISPNYDPMGQVFGAGYSLINDVIYGRQLYSEGDKMGAYARWAPITIRNIITANRWREEGIDFKRGVHYEPTKWEITQKRLGFTPYTVGEQYEIRNIEGHYSKERASLRRSYINAVKNDDHKEATKIVEKIKKHNRAADDAMYVWFYFAKHKIGEEEYEKIYNSVTITEDHITNWYNDALKE